MKKKWSWAFSTYVLVHQGHNEIIEICNHAGVSSLELGVEAIAKYGVGRGEREIEKIKRQYREAGIDLFSLHLPFFAEDDIASFYNTLRLRAVRKMERIFEDAAELGCSTVIMHPSPVSQKCCVEVEGIDRFLQAMDKSLGILLPRAEKLGLTIAIENLPPFPHGCRLSSIPEHFSLFIEKFAHPHFGFCLDTGHAHIAGGPDGPAEFFSAMDRHIKAFHLADNSGDRDLHLAPGRGLIDWSMVFAGIARINFSSPLCIEAPPFSYAAYGTDGGYSLDAWRGLVETTGKLAAENRVEQGGAMPG